MPLSPVSKLFLTSSTSQLNYLVINISVPVVGRRQTVCTTVGCRQLFNYLSHCFLPPIITIMPAIDRMIRIIAGASIALSPVSLLFPVALMTI